MPRSHLHRLCTTLRRNILSHSLLPPSSRLLISLSGGQDSLALTECLLHLHTTTTSWAAFSLVYCDHRWPHDVGNATFVSNYARARSLPLHILDANDSLPFAQTETAARQWRYTTLAHLARTRGFSHVVTAHTATDLAETVLYNLCRGSGSDGLCALSWQRRLADRVMLVRPFLSVLREDTRRLCDELHLDYWRDVYNEDPLFARNRIRHRVMPRLRDDINGNVERALARVAHILRDEAACLEALADDIAADAVCVEHTNDECVVLLQSQALKRRHVALQRRVVRRVLETHLHMTYAKPAFHHVEAVRGLLQREVGKRVASLPGHAHAFVRDEQYLCIRIPRPSGVDAAPAVRPSVRRGERGVREALCATIVE